jgi:uncharacterized OB-fold protein
VTADATLPVVRCEHCHGRFLPRPGPCPRCGSSDLTPGEISAKAVVLATTELQAPAAGWSAPHRLAIVEAVEHVRILVVARGGLPDIGDVVEVHRSGELYEIGGKPALSP